MSHDTTADALNMLKNAKKAGKDNVKIKIVSKLFTEILKIMKQEGAIKKYKVNQEEKFIEISLGDFSESKAIKPRFSTSKNQIEKYKRRYLPAKNIGTIILSTNKGLITHKEAEEEKIGGCLIAYFY